MTEYMRASAALEDFLAFMRDVSPALRIAQAEMAEANEETQDILHAVEFEAYDADQVFLMTGRLAGVRQKRRAAKEQIERLEPVENWIRENAAAMKSLEALLGTVRKTEKRQTERVYAQRTGIMDGLLADPERNGGEQND